MKLLSPRYLAGLALAAALTAFACVPPPANNNNSVPKNGNTNINTNGNSNARTEATPLAACTAGPPADVLAKIEAEIKKDPSLAGQLKTNFLVEVKPVASTTYLEAIVGGKVSGRDDLKKILDIIGGFETSDCVRKVTLSASRDPENTNKVGFESDPCPWPTRSCPDGSCQEVCPSQIERQSAPSSTADKADTNKAANTSNANGARPTASPAISNANANANIKRP